MWRMTTFTVFLVLLLFLCWLKMLNLPASLQNKSTRIRTCLRGEFQPRLRFRSAHRAEILLRLHAQFQPGHETKISVRRSSEVRKHSQWACLRSFFGPGWNSVSITWDFFRFSGPFGRAGNPSPVWGYRARIFQKSVWNFSRGWNSPHNRALRPYCKILTKKEPIRARGLA